MPSQEFDRRYMLRRTIFPWKFQQSIDEAVDYARTYGIDEIIWKIDTEEFSHGIPSLELIGSYIPWLEKSRHELERIGVSMAINPWVTQGMRDAGWDCRAAFPDFGWLTDISGIAAKSQGCPLSSGWRNWFFTTYEMYASAHPRVLWVEDDFRIHRHRPVWHSCYCDTHMEQFSQHVGRRWNREDLGREILKSGEPSPVRTQWFDFLGGVMAQVLEETAERVAAVDPKVRMGLMCSSPSMHAAETRDWDRCMKAIQAHHETATVRPMMANYQESTLRSLYEARDGVSWTLSCMRTPVHACTELENWPFTRYSKSVKVSRAQVLLSAALGCPSITFNMYDHVGTPLAAEPQYGQMLKAIRPRMDALVGAYGPGGLERGVGMLHHEHGPKFRRLREDARFTDLMLGGEPLQDIAQALGASATWGKTPVVAISGRKLEAYGDRLDEVFSGGVLLDLSALETLISMGRGDLAGVRLLGTFERKEKETPAEEILDARFGGAAQKYVTVDHLGLEVRIGMVQPLDGARVISRLVNADRQEVMPAFTVFQNALGGRVAVCPYELSAGLPVWFLNWNRKDQLTAVLDWLFGGNLPLSVECGAYPLAIRTDYADRVMVSVMNLSQDEYPQVKLTLKDVPPGRNASVLGTDATWHELPHSALVRAGDRLVITSHDALATLEMVTFKIS